MTGINMTAAAAVNNVAGVNIMRPKNAQVGDQEVANIQFCLYE
jgi:hypothetical protein